MSHTHFSPSFCCLIQKYQRNGDQTATTQVRFLKNDPYSCRLHVSKPKQAINALQSYCVRVDVACVVLRLTRS